MIQVGHERGLGMGVADEERAVVLQLFLRLPRFPQRCLRTSRGELCSFLFASTAASLFYFEVLRDIFIDRNVSAVKKKSFKPAR